MASLAVLRVSPPTVQANSASLIDLFKQLRAVKQSLGEFQDDPVFAEAVTVAKLSVTRREEKRQIDVVAATAAAMLDPQLCEHILPNSGVENFLLDQGTLYLLWKRFGKQQDWPDERKDEAQRHVRLRLQAQFNLYALHQSPFADALQDCVNLEVFWQAKLRSAEELATVALFFLTAPVSEAAVERTFSCGRVPLSLQGLSEALPIKNLWILHYAIS